MVEPTVAALSSNRTVWKFGPLRGQANVVAMPKDAQILHVHFQPADQLFVWALVNPSEPLTEERRIGVIPTGLDSLPFDGHTYHYIGTAHTREGTVWHVFEAIAGDSV